MKKSMKRKLYKQSLYIILCTFFGALIMGFEAYNELGGSRYFDENFVFDYMGYILISLLTLGGATFGLIFGLLTSFIYKKTKRSKRLHTK